MNKHTPVTPSLATTRARIRGRGAQCLQAVLIAQLVLPPGLAFAAPQGGTIVDGEGSISEAGRQTNIQQLSDRLTATFDRFDIDVDESVLIRQPDVTSLFIGHVANDRATTIFGTLSANGGVLLINPQGVIFGETARVDVHSLVAAAIDVPVEKLTGDLVEIELSGALAGAVLNRGLINAATGGRVALVGGDVKNEGVIVARLGNVTLGSTNRAVISFDGEGLIALRLDDADDDVRGRIENLGRIEADGGTVLLDSRIARGVVDGAVNNDGVLQANSLVRRDGRVVLMARDDVANRGTIDVAAAEAGANGGIAELDGDDVTTSGAIDARGDRGGEIRVAGRGTTLVDGGSIEASGSTGRGGNIAVTGQRVGLLADADVRADGTTGGGNVHVGGSLRGEGPLPNALRTYVGADASVSANATESGRGGEVIVWSDERTAVNGTVSARGVDEGGFIEASSAKTLSVDGDLDVGASNGQGGTLLYDPDRVEFVGTNGASTDGDDTDASGATLTGNQVLFADAPADATEPFQIRESELETPTGAANVIIEARSGMTASGTFGNDDIALASGRNLTLRTRNDDDQGDTGSGIDLTGPTNALTLRTQGTGTILIQTGQSGGTDILPAPVVIDAIAGGGDVTIAASGAITLNQTVASGGAVMMTSDTGAIDLDGAVTATGGVTLTAHAMLEFESITASSVSLTSVTGTVDDDDDDGVDIAAPTVMLSAGDDLGNSGSPILMSTTTNLTFSVVNQFYLETQADLAVLSLTVDNPDNNESDLVAPNLTTFDVDENSTTIDIDVISTTSLALTVVAEDATGMNDLVVNAINVTATGSVNLTSVAGFVDDNDDDDVIDITAGTVSISAATDIGDLGSEIDLASTTNLTLVSSGTVNVETNMDLANLSLTVAGDQIGNNSDIVASNLNFTVTEVSNNLSLGLISDTTGLNLTVVSTAGDVLIGNVSVGAGSVSITSPGTIDNIDNAGIDITAATATLSAVGDIANTGAGNRLDIAGGTVLTITSATNAFVESPGAFTLNASGVTGNLEAQATNDLTLGAVTVAGTLTAIAGGAIDDNDDAGTDATATTVSLTAGTAIGDATTPVSLATTTNLTIDAGTSFNVANDTDLATLALLVDGTQIGATSALSATNLTFAATSNGAAMTTTIVDTTGLALTLDSSAGDLILANVNVGAGSASISSAGGIDDDNDAGVDLSAATITLTAAGDDIGDAGSGNRLDIGDGSAVTVTDAANVYLESAGAVTLTAITATSDVEAAAGTNLTVSAVTAGGTVTAVAGGVLDDDDDGAADITAPTVVLSSAAAIGDATTPVLLATTTNLSVTAGTTFNVANAADLATLSLTVNAATAGATSDITATNLDFVATSDATDLTVTTLTDTSHLDLTLTSTAGGLILGNVDLGAGTATISSATFIDDNDDAGTDLTSPTVSLTAATSAGDATTALKLSTTSSLTINAGTTFNVETNTGLDTLTLTVDGGTIGTTSDIAATGLTFAVTSNGSDLTVTDITDAGLDLSLVSSAGEVIVGNIDVGAGSATVTSAAGIADDGDGAADITAATITLTAAADIGASGAGNRFDVADGNTVTVAAANAYIESAGALTLNGTATGALEAQAGTNLTVGSVTADTVTAVAGNAIDDDDDAPADIVASTVALTSTTGSIGDATPLSLSTTTDLTFSAGTTFNIATTGDLTDLSLTIDGSAIGATSDLTATNLTFALTSNGTDLSVTALTDTTGLDLTLVSSSGDVVVDSIDVTLAGNATITSAAGIADDGDANADITAATITLTAANDIGATGAGNRFDIGSTSTVDVTAANAYLESSGSLTASGTVTGNFEAEAATNLVLTDVTAGQVTAIAGASIDDADVAGVDITAPVVSLDAGTSLGDATTPVALSTTTSLTLAAGTTFNVTGDADLADLSLTVDGSAIGATSDVAATNLTFAAATSGGNLTVSAITDTSGLALTLQSLAGGVIVDAIDVTAGGSVALTSAADLFDDADADVDITAGTITLTAIGDIGNAGSGNRLDIVDGAVVTIAAAANAYIEALASSFTLNANVTGDLEAEASDDITIASVTAGGTVTATAGGVIDDDDDVGDDLTATTVTLSAGTSIGDAVTPLGLATTTNLTFAAGTTFNLTNAADLTDLAMTVDGTAIGAASDLTATNLTFTLTSNGTDLTTTIVDTSGLTLGLTSTAGNVIVADINVTSGGSASIVSAGAIDDDNDGGTDLTAATIALDAVGAIANAGAGNRLDVADGSVVNVTGATSAFIEGPGSFTLSASGVAGAIEAQATTNLTLASVVAGTTLTATAGGTIDDNNDSGVDVTATTITLNAGGAIANTGTGNRLDIGGGSNVVITAATNAFVESPGAFTLNAAGVTGAIEAQATTNLTLASVVAGTTLTATAGGTIDDDNDGSVDVTATTITLNAGGAIANTGAGNRLDIGGGSNVVITAATNAFVESPGSFTLTASGVTGAIEAQATANLTLAVVVAGATLNAIAGGAIDDDNDGGVDATATTITLSAGGAIANTGAGNRLDIGGGSNVVITAATDAFVESPGSFTLTASGVTGAIEAQATTNLTLAAVVAGTTLNAIAGGAIDDDNDVGVDATATTITLSAGGAIANTGSGNRLDVADGSVVDITGATSAFVESPGSFTLRAANVGGVEAEATNDLTLASVVATGAVTGIAGNALTATLVDADSVTLSGAILVIDALTATTLIDLTSGTDITVGLLAANTVNLTANGGGIDDDDDGAVDIDATSINLTATGDIANAGTGNRLDVADGSVVNITGATDAFIESPGSFTLNAANVVDVEAQATNDVTLTSVVATGAVTGIAGGTLTATLVDADSVTLNGTVLAIDALTAATLIDLTSGTDITVGLLTADTVNLTANGGGIDDDDDAGVDINATTTTLTATGDIGDAGTGNRLDVADGSTVTATGTNVYIESPGTLAVAVAASSDVEVEAGSDLSLVGGSSAGGRFTGIAGGAITNGGGFSIASPAVSLAAGTSIGQILEVLPLLGTTDLTVVAGTTFNLSSDTNLATLSVTADANGIGSLSDITAPLLTFIVEGVGGDLVAAIVDANNIDVAIASSAGDIVVRALGSNLLVGTTTVTSAGDILHDNDAFIDFGATTIVLNAAGNIGGAPGTGNRIDIRSGATVTVNAGGSAWVEALASGGTFTLNGSAAADVEAEADDLFAGSITAGGTFTGIATNALDDDDDAGDDITATSIVLQAGAAAGDVVTPLGLATTSLTMSTAGTFNVAVNADLANLTLTLDAATVGTTSDLTATNLMVDATSDGTDLTTTIVDTTGLDLNLTTTAGDIVLANVDVGAGTVQLTSADDIRDDADAGVDLTAASITLTAADTIGTSGAGNGLDVASGSNVTIANAFDAFIDSPGTLTIQGTVTNDLAAVAATSLVIRSVTAGSSVAATAGTTLDDDNDVGVDINAPRIALAAGTDIANAGSGNRLDVVDGASVDVTSAANAFIESPGAFTLAGNVSGTLEAQAANALTLGSVAAALQLNATAGTTIVDDGTPMTSATSALIVLAAGDDIGSAGAGNRLDIGDGSTVSVILADNAYLESAGSFALNASGVAADIEAEAATDLQLASVVAGGALTAIAGGNIADDGDAGVDAAAATITLDAGLDIGSSGAGNRLDVAAGSAVVITGASNAFLESPGALTLDASGIAGNLEAQAATDLMLVVANAGGNVSGIAGMLLTATDVDSGSATLTSGTNLVATDVSTPGGAATLAAGANATIDLITADTVSVNAGGTIDDDNDAGVDIAATAITLNAVGDIGNAGAGNRLDVADASTVSVTQAASAFIEGPGSFTLDTANVANDVEAEAASNLTLATVAATGNVLGVSGALLIATDIDAASTTLNAGTALSAIDVNVGAGTAALISGTATTIGLVTAGTATITAGSTIDDDNDAGVDIAAAIITLNAIGDIANTGAGNRLDVANASTVNVTRAANAFIEGPGSFTLNTANVTGGVEAQATNNLTLASVTAAGNVLGVSGALLTATDVDAVNATLNAGSALNAIDVNVGAGAATLTSGTSTTIDLVTADTASVTAGTTIDDDNDAGVDIAAAVITLNAGSDIANVGAGNRLDVADAATVTVTGAANAFIEGPGSFTLNTANVAGSVEAQATNNLTLASVTAAGNVGGVSGALLTATDLDATSATLNAGSALNAIDVNVGAGTATLTSGTSTTIDLVTAGTASVTAGTTIDDDNDAGVDIAAATITLNAGGDIADAGAGNGLDVADASTVSVTQAANAFIEGPGSFTLDTANVSGDVEAQATSDLTLASVTATGNVLGVSGALLTASDLDAANATLNAGSALSAIDVNVGTGTATLTSGTSTTIDLVTAGTANVTAGTTIDDDNDAGVDIAAASITLDAVGDIANAGAGNRLDVANASTVSVTQAASAFIEGPGSFTLNTANVMGNVEAQATNDLTLASVTATGDVLGVSGAALTATDVDSANATLNAGSTLNAIDVNAGTGTGTATLTSGTSTTIDLVTAGTASVTAGTTIDDDNDAGVDIAAATITLNAGGDIANASSGNRLDVADAATVTVTGAASAFIEGPGSFALNTANVTGGVEAQATNDLTLASVTATGNVLGVSGALLTATDVDAANATLNAGSALNAIDVSVGTGTATLTSGTSTTIDLVTAGTASVTAGTTIDDDDDAGIDIAAATITLNAVGDIANTGSGNRLDVADGSTVSVTRATNAFIEGPGSFTLNTSNVTNSVEAQAPSNLTLASVTATGNVLGVSGALLTATDVDAANATLNAGVALNAIDVNVGTGSATLTSGTSTTIDLVTAGTASVTAGTTIDDDNDAGVDIAAAIITLNAVGDIANAGAGNRLDVADGSTVSVTRATNAFIEGPVSFTLNTANVANGVEAQATNDLTLAAVTATGNVLGVSGGLLTATDVDAANATLNAGSALNAIDVNVGTGSATLISSTSTTIDLVTAGTASVTAGTTIDDDNDAEVDIAAAIITLNAVGDIANAGAGNRLDVADAATVTIARAANAFVEGPGSFTLNTSNVTDSLEAQATNDLTLAAVTATGNVLGVSGALLTATDVDAANATLNAGSALNAIDVNVGTGSATLTSGTSTTIDLVTAGTASVTAGTTIDDDNDAGVDLAAGSITLNAVGDIANAGAGNRLDVADAATVSVTRATNAFIEGPGSFTLNTANVTNGVEAQATSNLTLASVAATGNVLAISGALLTATDVDAANATLNAGSALSAIDVNVGAGTATLTSGTSTTIDVVAAGTASVTAGTTIDDDNDAGVDIAAAIITLNAASDIANAGAGNRLDVADAATVTVTGATNAFIEGPGSFTLNTLNVTNEVEAQATDNLTFAAVAATGNVLGVSGADLTASDVDAANATLSAGSALSVTDVNVGGGDAMLTSGTSTTIDLVTAGTATVTAGTTIDDDGDAEVDIAAPTITLHAVGNIANAGNGNRLDVADASTVTITRAGSAFVESPGALTLNATNVSANVEASAATSLTLASVSAAGNVHGTAGGALTATDVDGGSTTLDAGAMLKITDVNVGTGSATLTSGTDTLIDRVTAGSVAVVAAGSIDDDNDADIDIAAATISLAATNDIANAGDGNRLDVADGSTVTITRATNAFIEGPASFTLNAMNVSADIEASAATALTLASVAAVGDLVATAGTTLTASAVTTATTTLTSAGSTAVGTITSGSVSITSGAAIADADGGTDAGISAATIELDAIGDIGGAGAGNRLDIGNLSAVTVTRAANAFVESAASFALDVENVANVEAAAAADLDVGVIDASGTVTLIGTNINLDQRIAGNAGITFDATNLVVVGDGEVIVDADAGAVDFGDLTIRDGADGIGSAAIGTAAAGATDLFVIRVGDGIELTVPTVMFEDPRTLVIARSGDLTLGDIDIFGFADGVGLRAIAEGTLEVTGDVTVRNGTIELVALEGQFLQPTGSIDAVDGDLFIAGTGIGFTDLHAGGDLLLFSDGTVVDFVVATVAIGALDDDLADRTDAVADGVLGFFADGDVGSSLRPLAFETGQLIFRNIGVGTLPDAGVGFVDVQLNEAGRDRESLIRNQFITAAASNELQFTLNALLSNERVTNLAVSSGSVEAASRLAGALVGSRLVAAELEVLLVPEDIFLIVRRRQYDRADPDQCFEPELSPDGQSRCTRQQVTDAVERLLDSLQRALRDWRPAAEPVAEPAPLPELAALR